MEVLVELLGVFGDSQRTLVSLQIKFLLKFLVKSVDELLVELFGESTKLLYVYLFIYNLFRISSAHAD